MFRTAFRLPFRLLGIPVHLDVTFLLILPVLAWMIGQNVGVFIEVLELPIDPGPLQSGWTPFLVGFVAALGLFLSVLIHELGHSVVAQRYGIRVRRIVLWILGGMAQFESIPQRPGVEAIISIAGPITSYLIAAVCWLSFTQLDGSPIAHFVFAYLAWMNAFLATFNLLPALPLDGGRVLRSLLAMRMPHLRATQVSAGISKVLALLMGLLGFVSLNIFLMLIALFVYMAVTGESETATVLEGLRGVRVGDVMTRNVKTVRPELQIGALLEKMMHHGHLGYPVVEESGNMVGVVTLEDVRGMAGSDKDGKTTVGEIMSRNMRTIQDNASAWEAFQKMSGNNFGRLIVVDGQGRLAGILSKTDLIRAIQVRMVGSALDSETST